MEMKKQRHHAMQKADALVAASEGAGRQMTATEEADFEVCMAAVNALTPKIAQRESLNTITVTDAGVVVDGKRHYHSETQRTLSAEYASDFFAWIGSNGQKIGAALYEGGDGSAGGFAVPSFVDQQIIPLAPLETGIRQLAMVIPTVADLKLPRKKAHGTAAGKAESGVSDNFFTVAAPQLEQTTLSAFMAGASEDASWELLQDVGAFQAFVVDDLLIAQQAYEEPKYISGSGVGEPQGLLTACDTTTPVSGLTIDGIYDLVATLNAIYHSGASFLMARPTSLVIRKLQRQANLFEPIWTSEGGVDRLLGYPVAYSASMPNCTTSANKPIVFGDFKRGFVIGDRGGSGINVKILDQPKALEGLLTLLAYRRTDSRVRRSEAVKAYVLS